jgi:hypothetical protein
MVNPHLASKYLHLATQTPESAAVQNAIAIACKGTPISVRLLIMQASTRLATVHRIRRQQQMLTICVAAKIDHWFRVRLIQSVPISKYRGVTR